jgi:uncharacterized protein YegP (UPF0339 family)
MRTSRFQVYHARDGWRWRLLAGNGRIIATGEAHTRWRDAERAITTVRRAIASGPRLQHAEG